jgi:hypothetical protein
LWGCSSFVPLDHAALVWRRGGMRVQKKWQNFGAKSSITNP